jgi:hypothetical protein
LDSFLVLCEVPLLSDENEIEDTVLGAEGLCRSTLTALGVDELFRGIVFMGLF